ncbi:hypothetical protein [Sorangium sp. So ce1000]|uniref:hypothetical protein n=1 Tax=Sorangium sp. So ce1000 TaxID=3133325 RepID=UPI003F5E66D0
MALMGVGRIVTVERPLITVPIRQYPWKNRRCTPNCRFFLQAGGVAVASTVLACGGGGSPYFYNNSSCPGSVEQANILSGDAS